nr:MAG TPA: hypothetical protein [Caudoviricetes sp.]
MGGTPERFLFCGFPVFALSYSVCSAFRRHLAYSLHSRSAVFLYLT